MPASGPEAGGLQAREWWVLSVLREAMEKASGYHSPWVGEAEELHCFDVVPKFYI